MTFEEARDFVMPFGMYKGDTLNSIASSYEGLKYLDWIVGEHLYGDVKDAIEAYLDDASVQRDLEACL